MSLTEIANILGKPYFQAHNCLIYLIQEVVWNYGAGVAGSKFFSPRNEKFLWYVKNQDKYTFNLDEVRDPNVKYPNQKKNGKIKVNLKGKNPTDVWQFPKVTSGKNRASKERTPHPAQFPVAVVDRIIKSASNLNEIVLAPFMGSETTAILALGLQRQVIGFEIRADYCQIFASRIDDFLMDKELREAQLSLF
ncbi:MULTISPECIES: site-specific DNA-methyltransferase [unclassified Microcoleus]|uniref:site-specific DNA-methyltransferase n=1 Tax=unclassified Microcoleus TaxID=2642155 RepID=UPI002FD61027